MQWIPLNSDAQLTQLIQQSAARPQVIFKHSTRCPISSMAKSRLDRSQQPQGADFHFLDLIAYRPLSQKVAEVFKITHESPQVLIIKNGSKYNTFTLKRSSLKINITAVR